ncbi:LCP family protein [filamentous cyanobacterium LEGE 11480]|uniref:LCP family protein n=1 Tax=Romeriopsis navalis LEGE 11480 TaxID=2777977 RepID=A0A928Z3P6_9CYAN|nr:LCP family protein [Romeriopsis navalis]MBE9030904.1 LCP family protein [Romeriopsis navalis LEGE 11480]
MHHHPQKFRFGQWIGRAAIVLGASAVAASLGALAAVTIPIPGALSPQEGQRLLSGLVKNGFQYKVSRPVTVLVMGIDRVPDAADQAAIFSGRSDTMLILRIDPKENSVNMLSIPRDTQVEVPGIGVTKINQANASGGPLLARETVAGALNGIEIDRYVRVSTDAFRELVNQLGGVRVYVPTDMKYEDKTQNLNIDLEAGWRHLNGNQAEQFARFRNDNFGDIGRVQRQQALLKALRGQVSNPLTIARIPSIIKSMEKYIDTNLSFEEMIALVTLGLKMEQKDFQMVLLPGRFSGVDEFRSSYWIMDPDGRDRILRQYFKQTDDRDTETADTSQYDLRIAVQNATDDPDAGVRVADYLAAQGYYRVFMTKPWAESQAKTQVIVQGGQLDAAKSIQRELRIDQVEAASTGDLDSDLTIRVGNDWEQLSLDNFRR